MSEGAHWRGELKKLEYNEKRVGRYMFPNTLPVSQWLVMRNDDGSLSDLVMKLVTTRNTTGHSDSSLGKEILLQYTDNTQVWAFIHLMRIKWAIDLERHRYYVSFDDTYDTQAEAESQL